MRQSSTRKTTQAAPGTLHERLRRAESRVRELERVGHAEQALRESEERYRRLFQDDLTGDYLATADGTLLDCNPAFVAILGFSSRAQALKTNLRHLHPHPHEYDLFLEALRAAGKLEHYECIRQRRDGVAIHVVENVVAVLDARGALCQIRGYLFDNTAAKVAERALREAEHRYRSLIDFLPDAVVVSDGSERIVFANPAAASLFGVPQPEALIGRSLLDFIQAEEHASVRARSLMALEGGRAGSPLQRVVLRADGDRLYVETAVTPILFDDRPCVLRVNHNITARVLAEERLLQKDHEISMQLQKIEKLNTALTTLLEHREQATEQRMAGVRTTLEELVLSYIANLKTTSLSSEQQILVEIMEANLRNVTSSFARQVESWKTKLTPTELQIADLLRVGKRTKDISALLRVSPSAVNFHRNNIRQKLGLTGRPLNLVSFLRTSAGSTQEPAALEGGRGAIVRRRGRWGLRHLSQGKIRGS
jgi:PAS domain S-box-containing protein